FAHGEQRLTRGVLRRIGRQLARYAINPTDANTRLSPSRHGDFVAQRVDCKTEDVEPDRHVADRGRRKHSCPLAHRRAPRYAARRSRSANTPPAVTSGPAPGPWTISGLSQYRRVANRTTLSVSAMLANACLDSNSTTPTVAFPSDVRRPT